MLKITFIFLLLTFELQAQINVFSNFENGNVALISKNDTINTLVFQPALQTDSNTTRCWYYFGLTGFDKQKTVTMYCQNEYVKSANYPVFSYDNENWTHIGAKFYDDTTKVIRYNFTNDTVYFAAGYPYTYTKLIGFVNEIAKKKCVDTSTLCYSEEQRRVPILTIFNHAKTQKQMIWIICRQHAFETTANFVLEGFINFLTSQENSAVKLRDKVKVFVVPMVDVDNVYKGASGRMQKPVDFNRDWSLNPHWNAIKALETAIENSSKSYEYLLFLDFHSTYPGTYKPTFSIFNEYERSDIRFKNIGKLINIFSKYSGYSIMQIRGDCDCFYADVFNNGYVNKQIKTKKISTTIECDWFYNYDNNELTIERQRQIGENLAKAVCEFAK